MRDRDKVLIVDDEQAIVELMGLYLKSDYEVIPAYSGQEALDKVKAEKPDIILLDVMMPDMNGYEVCRILKTSVETQFLPVVMVTALSGKDDRIKGIEVGADEFLGKPVNRLELVTRVRSLLRIKHLQDKILAERNEAMNYLDIAGFIVFVIDSKMKIHLVNTKGNDILGYGEFELIGNDFIKSLVPDKLEDELRGMFDKALDKQLELPEFTEHPVITKDGNEIPMRWYDVILKDNEGNATGILRSGEDISKFK
ncbi:response regulator [Methanolobus sp.]|jgi:two-component system cell cycle response regulator|uniref:response regulator n=1 Tax=Methanolobus sp. TaxID=1874737 RepID=UPI0025F77E07|nr:response regulator [Methanolobus sp.]